MRNVYLLLAIVGAVVPYLFFAGFFASAGINLPGFISALFVNGAAAGFTVDLLISSAVFWIFMFSRRATEPEAPQPWLFIVLNLTIGLSCALPAYLYAITPKTAAQPA